MTPLHAMQWSGNVEYHIGCRKRKCETAELLPTAPAAGSSSWLQLSVARFRSSAAWDNVEPLRVELDSGLQTNNRLR